MFDQQRVHDLVAKIDWDDMRQVAADVPAVLEELATDPEWITAAFDNLVTDPHLRALTERLAELDKLVLFDDRDTGVRVRLHIFRQGYFDRPHNHRFSFGTRILSGSYLHTVYGDFPDADLTIDARSLIPKLVKREVAGTGYTIEHTIVHSVAADADTITLTVRGPAQKDRMLIVDPTTDEVWWVVGQKQEDPAEVAKRRLDDERLRDIRDLLQSRGIVR